MTRSISPISYTAMRLNNRYMYLLGKLDTNNKYYLLSSLLDPSGTCVFLVCDISWILLWNYGSLCETCLLYVSYMFGISLVHAWEMFETSLGHFWVIYRTFLEHLLDLSGACLGHVWDMSGTCLEPVWNLSDTCLRHVQGYAVAGYWIRFGYVLWLVSACCMRNFHCKRGKSSAAGEIFIVKYPSQSPMHPLWRGGAHHWTCLKHVWNMFETCLGHLSDLSDLCLELVSNLSGTWLEYS